MAARAGAMQGAWALAALVMAVSGCGSHAFDVIRTATVSLHSGDTVDAQTLDGFTPIRLLKDAVMRRQDVARSALNRVSAHAVTLTVVSPGAGQDLAFLTDLTATLHAAGLPDRPIATGGPFAAGENVVALTLQPGDLTAYFAKDDPSITLSAPGQAAPGELQIRIELALAVEVSSGTILVE